MRQYRVIQGAALAVIPPACFIATELAFGDAYLPVATAYISFILVLRFSDLGTFLHLESLRELWEREASVARSFVFEGGEFGYPIVKMRGSLALSDATLSNLARIRFLVSETSSVLSSLGDEFYKILSLNIVVLLFLMILTPPHRAGAAPTSALGVANVSPQIATPAQQGSTSAQKAATSTLKAGGSVSSVTSLEAQAKLALSYFAVIVQVIWFGRVAFYFRQKNRDVCYQANAVRLPSLDPSAAPAGGATTSSGSMQSGSAA